MTRHERVCTTYRLICVLLSVQAYGLQSSKREQSWREVFHRVDDDNNGVLDVDEFMQAMGMIKGVNMAPVRMRSLFLEAMNDTGREFIELEQFVAVRCLACLASGLADHRLLAHHAGTRCAARLQLVRKHDFKFDTPLTDIAAGGVAGSAADTQPGDTASGEDGDSSATGRSTAVTEGTQKKKADFRMLYSSEGFTMLQDSLADQKAVRCVQLTAGCILLTWKCNMCGWYRAGVLGTQGNVEAAQARR